MASVERVGVASVIEGFDMFVDHGAKYYSLWQGTKDMKFAYSGEDIEGGGKEILLQTLQAAAVLNNTAVYTLKFYEIIPNSGIKSDTAISGSFNFRISPTANSIQGMAGIGSLGDPVQQEILTRLKALEEGGAVGEIEEPSLQDRLMGFLESDEIRPQLGRVAGLVADKIFNFLSPGSVPPAGGGGGISGMQAETEDAKIQMALRQLSKHDANLGDNLLMLAELAEKNIGFYNMAILQLKQTLGK